MYGLLLPRLCLFKFLTLNKCYKTKKWFLSTRKITLKDPDSVRLLLFGETESILYFKIAG